MPRGIGTIIPLALAGAVAAAPPPPADARMTIVYDVVEGVNALTGATAGPGALVPATDGLYQQSIATRGDAFPGPADDPRAGARFVAKILPKAPRSNENCSNAYLSTPDGTPRSAESMAALIRDGTGWSPAPGCTESSPPAPRQLGVGTFDSRMVFLDEPANVRSDLEPRMSASFAEAISTLAGEPATDVPGADAYDSAPTVAERVHSYVRFPQSLTTFPGRWADLWSALPKLGGVWLELYGYRGDATRAWEEVHYATWTRPFAREFVARGGDLRRLHLLMTASRRSPEADPGREPGDQWPWARSGAACMLLENGPGAYRVSRGGDAWSEFGEGFRETFSPGGAIADAPVPPDLAPSPVDCRPAYRLGATTTPTATQFADAVALLGRGALELPAGSIVPITDGPGAPGVAVDVAAGLPPWLGRRFAHDAGATVATTTGAVPVPVDEDGIARVALTGAPEPTPGLTLRGIAGGDLLGAARGLDGRLPDPHLTLLCPGARLPGEAIDGGCENVIAPRPDREWLPADDDRAWLLDSTTLVAPPAALTEASATGAAGGPAAVPPTTPPGGQEPPGPADAGESSAPVATGAETCRAVRTRRRSAAGTIRLTRQALVVQQRIDAAALRRLNAANAWIDAGVTEDDLCGGALGPDVFAGDVAWERGAAAAAVEGPSPRPLRIRRPGARRGTITLSRRQIRINDRISRALLLRAIATEERIDDLTGGNLAAGATLGDRVLRRGLLGTAVHRAGADLPARRLEIGGALRRVPVRLTAAQLRRTQRRSQRAITIANRVNDAVAAGLTDRRFRAGSIGAGRISIRGR